MADYTLRDVDDDLWRKLKVKAAQDGKPIRAVLLELVTKYVKPKRSSDALESNDR